MDIEDTIKRESYRDFDLVQLRHGKAAATRWHITHKESGMNRSYGFATSEDEAHRKIDKLLKTSPQGKED
jgi:hypothetical protein